MQEKCLLDQTVYKNGVSHLESLLDTDPFSSLSQIVAMIVAKPLQGHAAFAILSQAVDKSMIARPGQAEKIVALAMEAIISSRRAPQPALPTVNTVLNHLDALPVKMAIEHADTLVSFTPADTGTRKAALAAYNYHVERLHQADPQNAAAFLAARYREKPSSVTAALFRQRTILERRSASYNVQGPGLTG